MNKPGQGPLDIDIIPSVLSGASIGYMYYGNGLDIRPFAISGIYGMAWPNIRRNGYCLFTCLSISGNRRDWEINPPKHSKCAVYKRQETFA